MIEGSKKANSRKWKSWSVILTGSQLLFFKDPTWALTLQEQKRSEGLEKDSKGQTMLPRVARFVPDEVFPVKDAVAVLDQRMTNVSITFLSPPSHRMHEAKIDSTPTRSGFTCLIEHT